MMIILKSSSVDLAYSKMDEVKIVFARVIASWAAVVAWASWDDQGVAEACYRSITAQQNLFGCSQVEYHPQGIFNTKLLFSALSIQVFFIFFKSYL